VAVVIGGAFGAIVIAVVQDLLTPLIAAVVAKPDFSGLTLTVNNGKFLHGDFINELVSFVLIGAATYFFVVVPVNQLTARFTDSAAPVAPKTRGGWLGT
jgi:large conductance mechanosensitive channel